MFAIGDDVYRWGDVVRLAELRGEWSALAADVARGTAAAAELETRGEPIDDEAIDAAAREFRYERGLLAADELEAWLERHELTAADWHGYLRRSLARATRFPEAAGGDSAAEAAWSGARASAPGVSSGSRSELARLAAVSPGSPIEALDASLRRLQRRRGRRFGARRARSRRTVSSGCASPTRRSLRRTRERPHEAVLCVRSDGDSLDAVADAQGWRWSGTSAGWTSSTRRWGHGS